MKESLIEVKENILRLLNEEENRLIPRSVVEQKLSTRYDIGEIKIAISSLLDDFAVDLVVEYPHDDSELDTGRPYWFLKVLSPTETQELRELSPLDLSLLRILQETGDDDFPGQVPVDEVKAKLIAQGFPEDKIEWLHITDKVHRVRSTRAGELVPCYMIIPEYEKTEEYKRAQEQMWEESTKKEMFRMYIVDTHALANQILEAVRASPEGISKKAIITQLFRSDPAYLKDAFEIATDDNEIIPITLDSDEDGYKINPNFERDD